MCSGPGGRLGCAHVFPLVSVPRKRPERAKIKESACDQTVFACLHSSDQKIASRRNSRLPHFVGWTEGPRVCRTGAAGYQGSKNLAARWPAVASHTRGQFRWIKRSLPHGTAG